MDIREVILNKKHSLEMDELKTAHALAIGEFEKEIRESREIYDQSVDLLNNTINVQIAVINKRERTITSKQSRNCAFYAITNFFENKEWDSPCYEHLFKQSDCVDLIVSGIKDQETQDEWNVRGGHSVAYDIIKGTCSAFGWNHAKMVKDIKKGLEA